MDKKTTGIVATVATALLCGCPGLFAMCFGAIAAVAGFFPDSSIDVFGSSDPKSALGLGLGVLCVGILFVAVPILVGVLTLRKKPGEVNVEGPLPPAS